MALYAISDTHLSGAADKPMDIFGDRWKCYTEQLVEGWEALVGEDDTVVLAGDISWAMSIEEALPDLRLIDSLPGKKLIAKGNHDFWWATGAKLNAAVEENGFSTLKFLYNNSYLAEGFRICGSRGWFPDKKAAPSGTDFQKIVARECARIALSVRSEPIPLDDTPPDAPTLLFLHFPPAFGDVVCRPIVDTLHSLEIDRCFFGHIHGVYDVPPEYDFEGIRLSMTSADYLHFYPLLIR